MASHQCLRVCCFNVLAPSARICAPLDRQPWQERHSAICDFLLKLAADVVCLQEFDFAPTTPGFAELYKRKLGATYSLYTKQRTGRKHEGLAMLFRREVFTDSEVQNYDLEPSWCDRVAMVARLTLASSGRKLVVVNTHLTVAHASNDHDIPMCRPKQMQQVLQLLEQGGDDVLLCADLNCDHLEEEPHGPYSPAEVSKPVHMAFMGGFESALHSIHPGVRAISHTCSYAQDGCADYVLFRPSPTLTLSDAFLHPASLPQDTPWDEKFGWGPDASAVPLSDHRPLVVDFQV